MSKENKTQEQKNLMNLLSEASSYLTKKIQDANLSDSEKEKAAKIISDLVKGVDNLQNSKNK